MGQPNFHNMSIILQLQVIAQSLIDILRFEIGLPLTGCKAGVDEEEAYWGAYDYLEDYPGVLFKLSNLSKSAKLRWLVELTNARDSRQKTGRSLRRFPKRKSPASSNSQL